MLLVLAIRMTCTYIKDSYISGVKYMGVIRSIERGVLDTGWYEALHNYATVNFGMLVELHDPSAFRVEVVRDRVIAYPCFWFITWWWFMS